MQPIAGELLDEGRPILERVLASHGFAYVAGEADRGSGGPFATGEFRRGDRRLAFSCRRALGLVTYRLGDDWISHEDYMRLAVPRGVRSQYPGYGDDPIDGFRQLAADLELFARDFLQGSDAEFLKWVRQNRDHPRPTGFAALDPRTS